MPVAHRHSPEGRFIDPHALGRISNLELLARTVVEGFISGLHRSPYLGRSMDFAEHRAYMPGDDIRRIDWRLFARTDRFYIKEFEADTNTNLVLIVDISQTMNFSSDDRLTKLEYARYLAATLGFFSSKQRDRIGLMTFDQDLVDLVPPSAKNLKTVLRTIDRLEPGRRGNLREPMLKIADLVKRRSILVLLSDFYEEPQTVIEAMGFLKHRGSDLMVFHILDPAELDFPYDQSGEFKDLETAETVNVRPDYLRDQYRELVREHVQTLSSKLGEARIDYTLMNTSIPLDFALYSYLSARQRMVRAR